MDFGEQVHAAHLAVVTVGAAVLAPSAGWHLSVLERHASSVRRQRPRGDGSGSGAAGSDRSALVCSVQSGGPCLVLSGRGSCNVSSHLCSSDGGAPARHTRSRLRVRGMPVVAAAAPRQPRCCAHRRNYVRSMQSTSMYYVVIRSSQALPFRN